MQEYTYADFQNTLDVTGKIVSQAIYDHIANLCPEYKPFNIKPLNNTSTKWQMNFRKKPQFGKAFCSLYSVDGKLSMRVVGSGFMNYELFLRHNEFNDKVQNYIFYDGFCENCGIKCYNQFREYWYIHGVILTSGCMKRETSADYIGVIDDYPAIHNITENDIKDLLRLLDIQAKHITKPKNPKEIRGSNYAESLKKRCGDVIVVELEQTNLDIDNFVLSDYCNSKRLDKYTTEYSLTQMGAYDGLWLFHDAKAVCGEKGDSYSYTSIPKGRYASVTINDPFSFSAWGVWTYIAGWMRENDIDIRQLEIDGTSIPYLTKFYRQDNLAYMTVYVPIQ